MRRTKGPLWRGGWQKSLIFDWGREKLPLSQPARLTAPLTRGALGAPAPVRGTYMQSEV